AALAAADIAAEGGRPAEVSDLRRPAPLDIGPVAESVRRTGRLGSTDEAPVSGGLGADIAPRVGEQGFYHLPPPVPRVRGHDSPSPPSKPEKYHLPDSDRILDAVDRSLAA